VAPLAPSTGNKYNTNRFCLFLNISICSIFMMIDFLGPQHIYCTEYLTVFRIASRFR
jgi:hypothetical protein